MELKSPRKKGFRVPPFNAPLPICHDFSSSVYSSEYDWPLFTGKYNGTSVIIDDPNEITALSNKGFFGKGSLSKGSPKICKRKNHVNVVYESQWKRRKEWSETLTKVLKTPLISSESENCLPEKVEMESHIKDDVKLSLEVTQMEVQEASNDEVTDSSKSKEPAKNDHASDPSGEQKSTDKGDDGQLSISEVETELQKDSKEKESCDIVLLETNSRLKDNTDLLGENEILVVSDLGFNLDESFQMLNPHIEKECIKTVIEVLYLSLEEAFFLSYALNCLQVLDLASKFLSNKVMWNLFQESQPNFAETYVAYHHLRSQGWVVKSGLKYGGDFLLYKKGPIYYHASCIVIIQALNPDGTKVYDNKSWERMLSLNRISETAMKEVLICEVMKPDAPKEMLQDPSVLKEFKVNVLLLKRWHATQEKSKDEE